MNNRTKRYTAEEKQEIINFMKEHGRGSQKIAAAKFGVSPVSLSLWMRASKKRGRKPGSKNKEKKTVSYVDKLLPHAADIRRLADILEELSMLPVYELRLQQLNEELEQLVRQTGL